MVVAVARIALSLPGVSSLKQKRSIVRRVIDRTSHQFNAAVAEVEDQDSHRRAVIGMAVISSESKHANSMIDSVVEYAITTGASPVLEQSTELLHVSDHWGTNDRLPAWMHEDNSNA